MKESILSKKAFDFAFKSVEIYKYLQKEQKEYILSKQFLRSATSIGANIEESIGGQSERDFFMKMNIAYKETRECHYWIRLLIKSEFIGPDTGTGLLANCEEIERILAASIRTLRIKLNLK